VALLTARSVQAQAPAPPVTDLTAELRALGRQIEVDWRFFGSLEFGRGFRFNNPYRLATELGSSAQSASLIAPYGDLGLGFAVGPPDGFQHGASVHLAFAVQGVQQATVAACYQATYRGPQRFLAYGRLGPIVTTGPDFTLGGEVGAGFGWFLTGHLAVAGELVFDVFPGAGTYHVAVATYPILAGQLGVLVDYELLP
jgi:hypothetical protein